jgi:hypothetical protein
MDAARELIAVLTRAVVALETVSDPSAIVEP